MCSSRLKMTVVMIIVGVWMLGALVGCLALCAAARGAMPSPDSRIVESSGARADTITIHCGQPSRAAQPEYQLADAA